MKENERNAGDALELLTSQIDVHLKFMDCMEQIRWRFTSAFGITAIATLLFFSVRSGTVFPGLVNAPVLESDKMQAGIQLDKILGYAFVAIVSFGGLVTQVRIIGLFHGEWHRIRVLQAGLFERYKAMLSLLVHEDRAWRIPPIRPPVPIGKLFFTVHGVACLMFASLGSAAVVLIIREALASSGLDWLLLALFAEATLVFTYISLVASNHFIRRGILESSAEVSTQELDVSDLLGP